MAETGCTSVWGVGSRGLCRGHNSGKEAGVRVGASGHAGGSPHLQSVWQNLGHHPREPRVCLEPTGAAWRRMAGGSWGNVLPLLGFPGPRRKAGIRSTHPTEPQGWALLVKMQMSPEECPCSITSCPVTPEISPSPARPHCFASRHHGAWKMAEKADVEGRYPSEEAKVASTFLSFPGVYGIQERRRQEPWAKENPHSRSTSPHRKAPLHTAESRWALGSGREVPTRGRGRSCHPRAIPGEVRNSASIGSKFYDP